MHQLCRQGLRRYVRHSTVGLDAVSYAGPEHFLVDVQLVAQDMTPDVLSVGGSWERELQGAFRDIMASVSTPLAVITAMANDLAHGTTVSAFASLSLRPPIVHISLDRSSELLAVIDRTGQFGVNVVGGTSKFAGVPWHAPRDLKEPRGPVIGAAQFITAPWT